MTTLHDVRTAMRRGAVLIRHTVADATGRRTTRRYTLNGRRIDSTIVATLLRGNEIVPMEEGMTTPRTKLPATPHPPATLPPPRAPEDNSFPYRGPTDAAIAAALARGESSLRVWLRDREAAALRTQRERPA